MRGTRELRDKLEQAQAELQRTKAHLGKLRAHQSRERESLQQELEVARREVAALRTRLEGTESRERVPGPGGESPPALESLQVERAAQPAAGGRGAESGVVRGPAAPGGATSEVRALRDRLAEVQRELKQTQGALDKQRSRHAREQTALQRALEEARREAEKLRARIEKEEARARQSRPETVLGTPLSARDSTSAAQVLVALARRPASVEEALPALSRLLRLPPVDVRMRLSMSFPSILARLPAAEAEALRGALRAEGFAVVRSEVPRLASGLTGVRRFTFEASGLSVESAKGERQVVPYPELRLLVRGRRKTTKIEVEESVEYDRRGNRIRRQEEVRREDVEGFLWVYGGGVRAAFSLETSFAGLGDKRGLTRSDSLLRVMEELRARAPQAVVEERVFQMTNLSLPLVDTARSQEVLAGLIYQAIEEGLWP